MILDAATRQWWRTVGRRIDLDGAEAWLRAPMSEGSTVRDGWLATAARDAGGALVEDRADGGLIADMSALDGPGFAAADLAPGVRDFYEHTTRWRMEVWAGWNPLLQPGGALVSALFGRRVQQLALPTRPLDVAQGMDSRITLITDAAGEQVAAGWLRTLRATGEYVYSGCYSHRRLPGADRPSVHVAFPLESGNVQVFLRPDVGRDGSLWLRSPGDPWGGDGAYVTVRSGAGAHAARAPIREVFHVFVDDEGVVRCDHEMRLGRVRAVRLHYRLEPLT